MRPLVRAIATVALAAFGIAGSTAVSAAPGQLLSATPLAAPAGAHGWRIRYETRDEFGRATPSTGMVFAPVNRPGSVPTPRDIVAWQHGTVGIVPSCSPSAARDRLTSIPQLDTMLAHGWVVVATDYPGLGTPGPHTYLGGRAAAYAVLDGLTAARGISETRAGNRYALWGHSQGAHASLWAGQQRAAAPGLMLTSVVAASPPTQLAQNIAGLGALQRGILTAFVLESWSRSYGAPLDTVVDRRTAGIIGRATTGCIGQTKTGGDQLVRVAVLSQRLGRLDLTRNGRWAALLERNTPGVAWSGIPLMIVSADQDPVVADSVTQAYVERVRAAGHTVSFVPLRSKDHATTAHETGDQAVAFIARGFDAAPKP